MQAMILIAKQIGLDYNGQPIASYVTATYGRSTITLQREVSEYVADATHNVIAVHNPYDLKRVLLETMSIDAANAAMEAVHDAFTETTCSHCGGGMYDGFPFAHSGCVRSELCD